MNTKGIFKTKRKDITVIASVTTKLVEFLPMVSFGNQTNPKCYGGIHKFIEFGFTIFHLKIVCLNALRLTLPMLLT